MENPIRPDSAPGQAFENAEDAALILGDQDITFNEEEITEDDKLGSDGSDNNPMSVENEPPAFVRGEVDVAEQMSRTTRAIDYKATSSLIRGARDDDFESLQGEPVPRPADVREMAVEMDKAALQGEELHERAADQLSSDSAEAEAGDEADRDGDVVHRDADEFVQGRDRVAHAREHGRPTGAYTDVGAGKSGVTRKSLRH